MKTTIALLLLAAAIVAAVYFLRKQTEDNIQNLNSNQAYT
jgi:septation ring formation regulator EzrA